MCRYYARHAPQIPFLRLVCASPPTSLTHSAFEQSNCESEFQDSHLQAIAILELQVPPFPPPHTQRLRKENLDACSLFYHLSMYHRFYQSQSFFAASLRSALLDPLHDLLDRFPAPFPFDSLPQSRESKQFRCARIDAPLAAQFEKEPLDRWRSQADLMIERVVATQSGALSVEFGAGFH